MDDKGLKIFMLLCLVPLLEDSFFRVVLLF